MLSMFSVCTLLYVHLFYFFKHPYEIEDVVSREIFLFVTFQMNYSGY